MPDNDEKHIEQDRKARRVRDREEERQKRRKEGLPPCLMISGWFLRHLSTTKYVRFQNDIQTIKAGFELYTSKDKNGQDNHNALNLTGMVHSHRVAKILIRHIVRYDPGVFDKMIENPDSVTDMETCSYISDAYLRYHSSDGAGQIIAKFKPNEIAPKVYAKALTYARRLENVDKQK